MALRAYIVEDSPTIRDNLIETLQELAEVQPVGLADTEQEARRWLGQNPDGWDVAVRMDETRPRIGNGIPATAARDRSADGRSLTVRSPG